MEEDLRLSEDTLRDNPDCLGLPRDEVKDYGMDQSVRDRIEIMRQEQHNER